MDDAELMAGLTVVPGVGPWSAQVFMLLHCLRLPNVFPAGDHGLRLALMRLDGQPNVPGPAQAAEGAASWSPFRSYAAAYLWRTGAG